MITKGFVNEWALSADDCIGKKIAWQYTDKAKISGIPSSVDLNLTAMPKEELYKLFNQDGAVDPPSIEPPASGDGCSAIILALIEQIIGYLENIKPKG